MISFAAFASFAVNQVFRKEISPCLRASVVEFHPFQPPALAVIRKALLTAEDAKGAK